MTVRHDKAIQIARRLRRAGFEAVFAGGCVRDLVMGLEPHDYDLATNAPPDEVERLFDQTIPIGAAFGVVLVVMDENQFEVATFRSEHSYTDGRHPDRVEFVTAEEDVQRRDFTVNGMLYDPFAEQVLDYVGGQEDIRRRLIRSIGDPGARFREDPLRILRAVRFAAGLDYEIEERTFAAIRERASTIFTVSAERIRDELERIFTGPQADRGLDLLHETGLLAVVLPEVETLRGVEQPEQFHPEGDVYTHTRLMLKGLASPSPALAWAVLLHDLGKPGTQTRSDRIRFNEHSRVGAELTAGIAHRLRFSNDLRQLVVALIENHMRFMHVREMKPSSLKRFFRLDRFDEHLELHRLDCLASHGDLANWDYCREKLASLPAEKIRPPRLITGHDLIAAGYSAGPRLGTILAAVEEAQLNEQLGSRDEALRFVREHFPISGPADEDAVE